MRLRLMHLESVYTRMFIIMCVAFIPIVLGLCFYVYQQHNYLVSYTQKTSQNFTNLAAHDESELFNSTHTLLRSMAAVPLIQSGNWQLCNKYLASLLQNQTTYVNLGVISLNGDALCEGTRSQQVLGTNFADRGYFQRALATHGIVAGEYQIGRLSKEPMIMVAMPLVGPHGKTMGVLYAALDLNSIARNRHKGQLAADARLTVLDREGTVLSTIPASPYVVGKPFPEPDILALTQASAQNAEIVARPDKSKWLISYAHAGLDNDPNALTLIYQEPIASLLYQTNRNFWAGAAIILTLTALALLIGWGGIQALVGRNVRYLTAAARRYGQRKFNTRIGNMLTGTEFQEIGRRFDAMARELGKQERLWAMSMQRQQGQNRVLRMVAQNTDLDDTLTELVRFTEEQNEGILASIILLATDGQHVESCIAPSLPASFAEQLIGLAIGPNTGSCGTAMYEKRVIIAHDINLSPYWADYKNLALDQGLRACWSHPILSPEERVLGSVAMYSKTPRRPSLEDLQAGQMVAELAAVAIEHRRQRHTLRYQSRHDMLTGLYNRTVLADHIAQAIKEAATTGGHVTVLVMDLDGFKEINDTLGHLLGDNLLRQVSERLRSITHFEADIARSGGNEFTFLIRNRDKTTSIQEIIESTLALVKQPYLLDGIQVQISASAGAARYPEAGLDANALMLQADRAMRQAKLEGSGYALHDPSVEDTEPQRLLMLSHLRKALASDEFILHYQPKLDLASNQIVGFEALLRWQNPVRGTMCPIEFIPTLELSDLIHPVTLWVIENAVKQCKAWHDKGYPLIMAANVSARNLLDLQLPEKIGDILANCGLDAEFLELEITESSIIADPDRSLNVLKRLHDIGIQISIDDFGTGYSSLAYLQKLPVDSLKIDRSFVMAASPETEGHSIISSIIGLAHNLRLSVTAEGVENDASLRLLRYLNCDYAQGYYISRPLAADEALAWLQEHSTWASPRQATPTTE